MPIKENGTQHFIHQRITAVLLIALILWLSFSVAFLPETDYRHIIEWIQFPINTILLSMTLVVAFYHLQLGLQVIIEDYVSTVPLQSFFLHMNKLVCLVLCLIGLYSLIKIFLL